MKIQVENGVQWHAVTENDGNQALITQPKIKIFAARNCY